MEWSPSLGDGAESKSGDGFSRFGKRNPNQEMAFPNVLRPGFRIYLPMFKFCRSFRQVVQWQSGRID